MKRGFGEEVPRVKRVRTLARAIAVTTVAVLILGPATEAFAVTKVVKAVRVASGWRWRDASGDQHTYIGRGDYIQWRNPTRRVHNVTAYSPNWSFARRLDPGERTTRLFRRLGNFRYRCTLHSSLTDTGCVGQCGIIHVVA